MTVFLFWNLNKKGLMQEVAQLCKDHNVDVLILAESVLLDVPLQMCLKETTGSIYIEVHNGLSGKLKVFHRYAPKSMTSLFDNDYRSLSIKMLTPPVGQSILVAAVHLSSKCYVDSEEQAYQTRVLIQSIEDIEKNVGHSRTLVIGDFNMSPFEGGLVDSDGFHSVMSQSIAEKRTRTVRQVERKFFYNPMWGRLGDASPGPPGTYYYANAANREFFWYMFDQVLLRPDLLPIFDINNLEVITEVNGVQLMKNDKVNRRFSDHLPIMISLPIETEGLLI